MITKFRLFENSDESMNSIYPIDNYGLSDEFDIISATDEEIGDSKKILKIIIYEVYKDI